MKGFKAILLGGVCLGLLAGHAGAGDSSSTPAWAAEAKMNPDWDGTMGPVTPAEPSSPVDTSTTMEIPSPGDAPLGVSGVTSFYGDTAPSSTPAWAQEAQMNPDYSDDAPAPEAQAAPADDSAAKAAEEAEAKRKAEEEAAAAAKAAEEAEAKRKAEEEAAAAAKAAEEAEAKRKAEEEAAAAAKAAEEAEAKRKAEEEAAAAAKAAEEAARKAAVTACTESISKAASAPILFAFNSASISNRSYAVLDAVAKTAKACPQGASIEVGGHTDSSGSADANKRLSQQRAQAVVDYLVKAGVDAAALKAMGYGSEKPVADNTSVAGRAKNRRIEFLLSAN